MISVKAGEPTPLKRGGASVVIKNGLPTHWQAWTMQSTAQKWVSFRRDSHCDFNYCCASLAEPHYLSTLIICRPPSFTDSHRDKPYSKKDT